MRDPDHPFLHPLFYGWRSRLRALLYRILCHRAIHAALAVSYFAACAGFDKDLVEVVIGSLYAILTLRG